MSTVNYNNSSNGSAIPETNGTALPKLSEITTPPKKPTESAPTAKKSKSAQAEEASSSAPPRYHRIGEVRIQQGTSLRSVSRKMNLSVQEIREQEDATFDLRISELLKWQEVLDVPLADLLIDSEGPLSEPVCERANMLRIMKTAKAIREGAHTRSILRLADMLIDQLVEIMPELASVSAWHTVGQRRTQEEVGRIVERSIPDSFFTDSSH
ncbi:MAG: hypothetical protein KDA57_01640 [Planctomycetales bacterium]|nr:hypothetical protein [Planctomycetales bacterium]